MAKTKAVTRYRTRTVARRRRSTSRGGNKISMAVIAGLIPGMIFTLEPVFYPGKPITEIPKRFLLAYTGLNTFKERPEWTSDRLGSGLIPLVAGMFAHAIAQRMGVNKWVGKYLPVNI